MQLWLLLFNGIGDFLRAVGGGGGGTGRTPGDVGGSGLLISGNGGGGRSRGDIGCDRSVDLLDGCCET